MGNFGKTGKIFVGSYFGKGIVYSSYFGLKLTKRDFAAT
jgi:hypothetical protein